MPDKQFAFCPVTNPELFMSRSRLAIQVCLAFAFGCSAAAAQTTSDADSQANLNRAIKIFDDMAKSSAQLHASATQSRMPKSDSQFLGAIPKFRRATDVFRQAISTETDLREPIRNVNKLIDPFTDYFKAMKLATPAVDAAEFKEYTQKELEWETLTTAERVDNNLQRANHFLKSSRGTGTISLTTMEFFTEIHGDLARLKWLANKLSAYKPIVRPGK
jgi:hypothetical protein